MLAVVLGASLFGLNGCYVKSAKAEKNKQLIIVSDYLMPSDTILFKDFAKKENLQLIIRNEKVDNIIGAFRNQGYSTGYDLIMLKSMYDVYQLHPIDCLHDIDHLANEFSTYKSNRFDYIGFGIDPYITIAHKDSVISLEGYNDLHEVPFISNLSDEDRIPMYASLMNDFDRVGTYHWIRDFKKSEQNLAYIQRYQTKETPILLTSYSDFYSGFEEDSILSYYTEIGFPSLTLSGGFYDMHTVCIVNQAEHYTAAESFLSYLLTEEVNIRINATLNTMDLYATEKEIGITSTPSSDQIQYYGMIKRILNKLN